MWISITDVTTIITKLLQMSSELKARLTSNSDIRMMVEEISAAAQAYRRAVSRYIELSNKQSTVDGEMIESERMTQQICLEVKKQEEISIYRLLAIFNLIVILGSIAAVLLGIVIATLITCSIYRIVVQIGELGMLLRMAKWEGSFVSILDADRVFYEETTYAVQTD